MTSLNYVCKRVVLAVSKTRFDMSLTWMPQEAKEAGCVTVSGLEMFVGQAAEQFRLFTGLQPPVDLMRQVVLDSLR